MKKLLFTLIAVLALPLFSVGQHASVGIRAGAGVWQTPSVYRGDGVDKAYRIICPEAGVFIRRETRGHWAFEAGLAATAGSRPAGIFIDCATGGLPTILETPEHIRAQTFSAPIRIQYGFGRNGRRLRNYAGLALAPAVERLVTTRRARNGISGEEMPGPSYTQYRFTGVLGIEDMVRYRALPGLDVHALISIRANGDAAVQQLGASLQLGAAYCF